MANKTLTDIYNENKIFNILEIFVGFIFFIQRSINNLFAKNTNNILIISLHNIGDTVFTIFAIKEITKKHINSKIFILTFNGISDIYYKGGINFKSIEINKNSSTFNNRLPSLSLVKKIKKIEPEIIYDITGTSISALLTAFQKSKYKYGMNITLFSKVYHKFYKIRNKPHLIDRYFDIIEHNSTDDEKSFPLKYNINDPIMIYPFAGWKAKEWGIKNFIYLANRLSQKNKILFLLGDKDLPNDIKSELNTDIKIIYTKTLTELFEIAENISLMISNDSGPLYIANMLGKPTFTIYGPTNPDFSKPYGNEHKTINKKLICSPYKDKQYCYTFAGYYCPDYLCMNQLTVDEVIVKIYSFIYDRK